MQAYPLTPPGLTSALSEHLPSLLSDERELAPRRPTASTTVFTISPPRLPSSDDTSVIYVAVPATTNTTNTTTPVLDIVVPVDPALIMSFPSRAVTYTRSSHFRVTEGSKKLWKLAALNSCTARHRAAMARRVQQRLGAEAKEKERMKNRPTLLQDLKNLAAKPRQPLCPAAVGTPEENGGNGKQVGVGEGGEVEVEFIITPIRNKSTTPIAQEEAAHVRRRAKNGSIKLRKLAAANMCVQKHHAATEVARKEAERARSVKKENRLRENRIKLAIQISTMAEDCLAARAGSKRSRRKPAPNLSRTFEAEISSAGVAIIG